jgi:hypothetical protein
MINYQNHPLAGATDLDSAFNKLWYFYRKYFLGLYLVSVIGSLLSSIFISGLDISSLQTTTDPNEMLEMMKEMAGPYALTMLVSIIISLVLHTWVLERPSPEPDFLPRLLKKTFVSLVTFLVVMILLGILAVILISVGIVLFVLPGLFATFYIITVGMFATPLILTETLNPLEAISGSFRLAHRNLWANMGWVIVVLLILLVTALVLGAIVMIPFSGSFIRSIINPEEAAAMFEMARNPVYIGLSALSSGLITPVVPILAFILYFRNRAEEVIVEVTTENEPGVKVEDLYPPMPDRE